MKFPVRYIFFGFLTIFLVQKGFAQEGNDPIVGDWQPSDAQSVISIYKGDPEKGEDADKFYGKIIWLKDPLDDAGNPIKDKENPEESLRDRPIKGLRILKDLEFVGGKEELKWENGSIYDPESGSTYRFFVKMDVADKNSMDARGYIGFSIFGRTDTWKRLLKKQ